MNYQDPIFTEYADARVPVVAPDADPNDLDVEPDQELYDEIMADFVPLPFVDEEPGKLVDRGEMAD